jgi:hypothetical protein
MVLFQDGTAKAVPLPTRMRYGESDICNEEAGLQLNHEGELGERK